MENEFYKGWQTGVTYEAKDKKGVSIESMLMLLDEMYKRRMNFLSLMMVSYAYFDPMHDGLCWPVRNKKLECLRDKDCINAQKETEFVTTVIAEAEKRGISVQLFTNIGIYNPQRVKLSYPDALEQVSKNKDNYKWLFCPDSPGAWELEKDEMEDLLNTYNHRNVKSIGYERISYAGGSCFCDFSQKTFKHYTGNDLSGYSRGDNVFEEWKILNITDKLKTFNDCIREIRSDMKICLHTSLASGWGHEADKLKGAGVDCVMPHIAHFPINQNDFNTLLDSIYPNDIILQVCVRNKALSNYNIWAKTPQIIKDIGTWIKDYKSNHSNLKGVVFFNENTVSNENRKAVYDLISEL